MDGINELVEWRIRLSHYKYLISPFHYIVNIYIYARIHTHSWGPFGRNWNKILYIRF